MKKETKFLTTPKQVRTLSLSLENVNSEFASSGDITLDIVENGYNQDKPIVVSGTGVDRHKVGAIIDGNNRFTALLAVLEILGDSVFDELCPEGVEILIVSDLTELELADLYNSEGIKKLATKSMLVKKYKKFSEIDGFSEAKIATKIKSQIDQVFRLTGKTLVKYNTIKAALKAGQIDTATFVAEYGKIRRGVTQLLKYCATNAVTVSMAERAYENEGDFSPLGLEATKAEFEVLHKAYAKDNDNRDENGKRHFSYSDLQAGKTPEFMKALDKVMECLQLKADKIPTENTPMLTKAAITAIRDNCKSEFMSTICNVILQLNKDTSLSSIDTALYALESGDTKASNKKPVLDAKLVSAVKAKVAGK